LQREYQKDLFSSFFVEWFELGFLMFSFTIVKNRHSIQIACFATGTFGQKRFLFCFLQYFLLEFLLQNLHLVTLPGAAQKTIMTDLDKSLGQNMQRKPPDKLIMAQSHLLFDSSHLIILVSRCGIDFLRR